MEDRLHLKHCANVRPLVEGLDLNQKLRKTHTAHRSEKGIHKEPNNLPWLLLAGFNFTKVQRGQRHN